MTEQELSHDISRETSGETSHETRWYKDAIIYELHVRSFFDSNADGIGDFPGLTQKLGYLQELGVTALWLLPFYPSPLKDDGYDIADYTEIHPSYGTMRDFKAFLKEAHQRGLKVITELVLNHTSDQHSWFQRARRAQPGSPWRNFYVWSDTPEKYEGTRIIFKDFESSNWSWDPIANAYYWHRFYAHQPDLNYDNPHVRTAMLKIVDFWLRLGVDGLRLDAVPYLFEREGTTGENLLQTHATLRRLRHHIDERYPNRMLLAEANQWPEEAAAYFGQGDECHMAFHFPLMPRLFMAVRMEDRFPIIDILEQTPPIPESAQWAVFLRNHDELTLEMVTEEERLYMYRAYAEHPESRINLGIRRRLAPLLNNHRRKIELMNGLLFSLTGTPVLYYGDEIGMGDNIYLGDRNGVRTPMQWSADRNAGFSHANPQQLYLPLIVDHEYHHESVHVEGQQRNPYSLLNWMRQLLALRRRYRAFGRGSLEFLHPRNQKVLAFLRHCEDEQILVVANLSHFLQHVELDLSAFAGQVPVEAFGKTPFPAIGELPYLLTIGPHSFHWFSLESQASARRAPDDEAHDLPVITIQDRWDEVVLGKARAALETALPDYLRSSAWFVSKGQTILDVTLLEAVPLPSKKTMAYLTMVQVDYTDGEPKVYSLPLTCASGAAADGVQERAPHAAIAWLRRAGAADGERALLYDAMWSAEVARALLDLMGGRRRLKGQLGVLEPSATALLRTYQARARRALTPATVQAEHNNTSVVYGQQLMLKLFRCVDGGLNPDLEIGRFLTRQGFHQTPPIAGALEYRPARGEPISMAMLQGYVPNQGEAWDVLLAELQRYFERPGVHDTEAPSFTAHMLLMLADQEPPAALQEPLSSARELARLLGQRTAELHLVLASDETDPAFAPQPITPFYQRSLYQAQRSLVGRVFHALEQAAPAVPEPMRTQVDTACAARELLLQRLRQATAAPLGGQRLRYHGDYHLGQVLYTGDDVVIFDFEGDPFQPVSERQLKRCPLTDVASMLWSFAALTASARLRRADETGDGAALAWLDGQARRWSCWVGAAFLRAYRETTQAAAFLPVTPDGVQRLLESLLLERALRALQAILTRRQHHLLPDTLTLLLAMIDAPAQR